jgi:hypothetical protein
VGATVVAGTVVATTVSMMTVGAITTEVGPVLKEPSVTRFANSRMMTVPSDVHVTEIVTNEPDDDDGEKTHPAAVPEFEKSPDAIPETTSENVSV